MKKVIAFGTFDIFHPGHISYLKQAKKLGDYLIVVVARDETVKKVKGEKPRKNEKTRLKIVKESQLAEKAMLGNLGDKYAIIKKYKPDVIALGYDQKSFSEGLKEKLKELKLKTKIVRLKAYQPQIFKSSKLQKLFLVK